MPHPPAEPCVDMVGPLPALYLRATRPPFLSVTLFACLIGLGTASRAVPLHAGLACVTVWLALVCHAAVNVLGGLALLVWVPGLFAIGLAGVLLGWAYSAPPLALNARGLGEAAVALCFALVAAGADAVQRGGLTAKPLFAAAGYGLAVTTILYVNQFPDWRAYALAGKRHWVVRLGPAQAQRLFVPLLPWCTPCRRRRSSAVHCRRQRRPCCCGAGLRRSWARRRHTAAPRWRDQGHDPGRESVRRGYCRRPVRRLTERVLTPARTA